MSGYALTEHGAGDPQRLAKLSPSAQIAALASHANAPKTAAQATALIQQFKEPDAERCCFFRYV